MLEVIITNIERLFNMTLLFLILSGCDHITLQDKSDQIDTLSISTSEDQLTTTYLLSDSTKIWIKNYNSSWVNNYLNGKLNTKLINRPGEVMSLQVFSNDSLMFSIEEKGHGHYISSGNCLFLTKYTESDSSIYQDILVISPPFVDSSLVSVECLESGLSIIDEFVIKEATATLLLNRKKCNSFDVRLKCYFHTSKQSFEYHRIFK